MRHAITLYGREGNNMRDASVVGVGKDVEAAFPNVADASLRDLCRRQDKATNSALESVISRIRSEAETISPFGSYLP
jgi:hypothetical protein